MPKSKNPSAGKKRGGGNKKRSLHELFKKNKKRILPQKLSAEEFQSYKADMSKVVEYANSVIDESLSKHEVSLELYRFLDGDEDRRFDISQLTNPDDVRVTMTELRTVLNTLTEDSKKSQVDSAIMEAEVYRGQFGNQHRSTYVDQDNITRIRRFNMDDVFDESGKLIRRAVDPAIASKTFAAYRRLEEDLAGYIGRQGQEMMFGSENLIILLYDFYEKNPGADYNYADTHETWDAYSYARPLIDQWILGQMREMEGINYDLSKANSIITSWEDIIDKRAF